MNDKRERSNQSLSFNQTDSRSLYFESAHVC